MGENSVLIVEDDRVTRGVVRAMFDRGGWDVLVAGTLAEGLALLDDEPAWVVLDLELPDGDGTEVMARVRSRGMATHVAVCTGTADHRRVSGVVDLRPDLFLIKPVCWERLYAILCDGDDVAPRLSRAVAPLG